MPIAIEPFTPATTTLKLSKVPNAIMPHDAALRRVRVDVVEMLEACRILQCAEQRQAVAPLALIRECRNGQAKPAEQRGQQRHGAGLEQGSTGQAQGNLQHYRADDITGRSVTCSPDYVRFWIFRHPTGITIWQESINFTWQGSRRAKAPKSKTAGRGPGRLKLRQFRLTAAARPFTAAARPLAAEPAQVSPGRAQASERAQAQPAAAASPVAQAASPAPRLPWSAAARGCPTRCSDRRSCRRARCPWPRRRTSCWCPEPSPWGCAGSG